MRMILLLGAVAALAATRAGAQPTTHTHEQHPAGKQHEAPAQHDPMMGNEKCCCEEMMREMHKMMEMMEMMQKHQGMGMDTPKAMPMPDEKPAH